MEIHLDNGTIKRPVCPLHYRKRSFSLSLARESFLQVHKLNKTKKWAKWNEGQHFFIWIFSSSSFLSSTQTPAGTSLSGEIFDLFFFVFFVESHVSHSLAGFRDKFKCKWTIERAASCLASFFSPLSQVFYLNLLFCSTRRPGEWYCEPLFFPRFCFFLVLCFIYILASWLWFSFSFSSSSRL